MIAVIITVVIIIEVMVMGITITIEVIVNANGFPAIGIVEIGYQEKEFADIDNNKRDNKNCADPLVVLT
jgi:hypothetical protein